MLRFRRPFAALLLRSLTGTALLLSSFQAHAQGSPSAKPFATEFTPPTDTLPPHPGAREHEGFYLRLGLGGGAFVLSRSAESNSLSSAPDFADSRITGFSVVSELSIGGTPLPGLVVAGSLINHNHPSPELERDDGRRIELGDTNMLIVLMGGTVDYYPRVDRGFHVGGTLGLSYIVAPSRSAFQQLGGVGPGLAGHVGYDFWISDDWSIGPALRLNLAYATANRSEGSLSGSEDSLLFSSALMFSAVRH